MNINCSQYRKTMELLGLKRRLEEEPLKPEERQEIEERIKKLEKELELD